jgi:uncharacterized protein (DUF2249 family)
MKNYESVTEPLVISEPKMGQPPPRASTNGPLKSALGALEIGFSVFINRSTYNVAPTIARLKPKKFTCRKEGAGCRVWRVEPKKKPVEKKPKTKSAK